MEKLTWLVVTLAEVAAKFVANTSVTSSLRPRRYYKIPKETLESALDDVEQLINFFVIESQRIVFAENIPATAAVRINALVDYKILTVPGFRRCIYLLLPRQAPPDVGHGSYHCLRRLSRSSRLRHEQGIHRCTG